MTTASATKNARGPTTPPGPPRRPGRGRPLAAAVLLGLAAIAGTSIWQLRSTDGIPDVGDPFDVAAALRPIPIADEDNAYVLYGEAKARFVRVPASLSRVIPTLQTLTWTKAGPTVRDYLEQNRAALEAWREGSERPEALYHQPGELAFDTLLPLVQDMRTLVALGGLEGTRHEEQGAMARAWEWYRAMLRYSRLVGRHGVLIERLIGSSMHAEAAARIVPWAADPRVDAKLLRRALAEALEADALTPSLSDALKLEYLMYIRDLRELRLMPTEIPLPGGEAGLLDQAATRAGVRAPIQRIWLRASNDVERSRRAGRMLFANWLAQVDRHAGRRAPLAVKEPVPIYASDPTAPPAANALLPEELAAVVDHNAVARHLFGADAQDFVSFRMAVWEGDGLVARERQRRSALLVRLAAELYRREKGEFPRTAGSLVGPYLKELPEGIKSDDPIPTVGE
jgi:hypothetical protein